MKTIAFTLALSLAATPLMASNGNWRVGNDQVHVVDNTIDVKTADGRARLLERVERAARTLCRERVDPARTECEVETVRQAALNQSGWGRALAIAIQERGPGQLAAR